MFWLSWLWSILLCLNIFMTKDKSENPQWKKRKERKKLNTVKDVIVGDHVFETSSHWFTSSFQLLVTSALVLYKLYLIFISGNFSFSFVSTSLAYINIPKNKRKTKITWDKKLTTTYTCTCPPSVVLCSCAFSPFDLGRILSNMAYVERLRPKGVPFFRLQVYERVMDFTSWSTCL